MDFTLGQSHAWKEGRRIVDLQELAKQMHCKHCKALLDLNLTINEIQFGLASVLYVMCQCGLLNDVHTGKKQENDSSRSMYEVNIKASINLLLYGMSAHNIISFLQSGLDVPLPPPGEDTCLILPLHSTIDVATTAAASPVAVTTAYSSALHQQLQTPQHPHLPPHHHHHNHHHHHHQQQQQALDVTQQKDVSETTHEAVKEFDDDTGNDVKIMNNNSNSDYYKYSSLRCSLCRPCPHQAKPHSKAEIRTLSPPPPPATTQKTPEKLKLTKDERDDLKINTKCTVCKIAFRSREHFRMHKILHPQIKKKLRVKCNDCSAEFPDRGKLRQHAKTHSGEARVKPYACELCEKSFHKKSQRSKHVKRCHVKENAHACNVCGKTTFTKSELREHVRIHTGERPYQCEVCERAFRRKDYLTVHMRQHTGAKPYRCQHCGEAFVQRVSLCKHLQTRHSLSATTLGDGDGGGGETSVVVGAQTLTQHHHPSATGHPHHHHHHTTSTTQGATVPTSPVLNSALFYQ